MVSLRKRIWIIAVAACALAGCATSGGTAAPVATPDMARWLEDVRILSSDAFGGRAPASTGERLTVDYLVRAFEAAGAVGGNDGSFVQQVPLVAVTGTITAPLQVTGDDGSQMTLAPGDEAVFWTRRLVDSIALSDSDLVFVGYGVVAPEYGWDDYAGIDVRGKTVVMLVNDPGFATGDPDLFTGRAMTYYGRWTYKFEEAARQGAAAAILVHEEAAAGYPWGVVRNGWTGPQFDLQRADGNAGRARLEGWITTDAARRLFGGLGADFDALSRAAQARGFEAVALGGRASAAVDNAIESSVSSNVVALLPGTVPGESVGVSAHWDHLGTDPAADGDGIYNGAVDNATGTAALLEMARVLAAEPRRRSIVFIAVTAEESGLLGSAWYAAHPTVPLETMAGLINIDSMVVTGATRDVEVVGFGSSEMEGLLEAAAARQDRVLVAEATPEKGFFYRSDHFNFAKRGVPVLYAESGVQHIGRGTAYGEAAAADYISNRYHQPSDAFDATWDVSSAAADLELYLDVVRALANGTAWPEWREGSEFRRVREASRASRATP